ncbi:hypothetical protein BH11MYX1_BH11MYX1_39490 [soil metagenome]
MQPAVAMTKLKLASLFLGSLVVASCAEQPPLAPISLSDADRTQLASLGVANVEREGTGFTLADSARQTIGVVRMDGDAIDVTLAAHRVVTQPTADAIAVECDGRGISLSRTIAMPVSALASLAACSEAMKVQAILVHAAIPQADVPVAPPKAASLQGYGCTALGSNSYCDGSTLVYSLDSICYDAAGFERIESTTYYILDAQYCY